MSLDQYFSQCISASANFPSSQYTFTVSLSSRSESVSIYLTSSRKTTLFLSSHFPILSLLLFIREKREKKTWLLSRIYSLWLSLSLPLSGYTFSLRTRVRKDHFTFRVKERKRSGSEWESQSLTQIQSESKREKSLSGKDRRREGREWISHYITLLDSLSKHLLLLKERFSLCFSNTHLDSLSLSLLSSLYPHPRVTVSWKGVLSFSRGCKERQITVHTAIFTCESQPTLSLKWIPLSLHLQTYWVIKCGKLKSIHSWVILFNVFSLASYLKETTSRISLLSNDRTKENNRNTNNDDNNKRRKTQRQGLQ